MEGRLYRELISQRFSERSSAGGVSPLMLAGVATTGAGGLPGGPQVIFTAPAPAPAAQPFMTTAREPNDAYVTPS